MHRDTILVIDDSSTIRRLADSTLSRAGYSVALAATAEDGLRSAEELRPGLILLDHQLPGTTGFDVCQKLLASNDLGHIPVVVSSTLRKRAYVEYADLPNVVDMLPKPYTEELLVTTVSNALDTGSLVVESQAQGTAVPEVIGELGDADLAGVFSGFTIREVIDFLNNGRKRGALEIEAGHNRYWIYLDKGRVQGITASGIPIAEITNRLPDALRELAPVLNLTFGHGGSELDGIIDLLNTNVLDPRLLRRLLRHQAAVLLLTCFTHDLRAFRFDTTVKHPPLYERLPLDVSTLALLVEGALTYDEDRLPPVSDQAVFARRPMRGQNLDRAGLGVQQARILGKLTAPLSVRDLADDLNWESQEVRRVLFGLQLADLVFYEDGPEVPDVLVFEQDLDAAENLNRALGSSQDYSFKVLHDALAFELMAKRCKPDAIVLDLSSPQGGHLFHQLRARHAHNNKLRWVAVIAEENHKSSEITEDFHALLSRPYSASELLESLDRLFQNTSSSATTAQPSVAAESVTDRDEVPSHTLEQTLCPQ